MKENRLPYDKSGGFKVPEGYFQDFEARMMARLTEEEKKTFGDNPFKVPDQYFAQLGDRVFEKLESTPKKSKVVPLFNRKVWSYVAGAAAVAAIFFSSIVINENGELSFEDLEVTAVENYLLESLENESPTQEPYVDYELTASANPNIDKEALFEYLHENIDEPALLLNED